MRGYVVQCQRCKMESKIYAPKPWPKGYQLTCDGETHITIVSELKPRRCGGKLIFIRYDGGKGAATPQSSHTL